MKKWLQIVGLPLVLAAMAAFSAGAVFGAGGGGGHGGGGGGGGGGGRGMGGGGGGMSSHFMGGQSFSGGSRSFSGSGNFSSQNASRSFSGNSSSAMSHMQNSGHWNNSANWSNGGSNWQHGMDHWNSGQNFHNNNWNSWNASNWHGNNWGWNNWHNNVGWYFAFAPFWYPGWYGGYPYDYGYGGGYAYETVYYPGATIAPQPSEELAAPLQVAQAPAEQAPQAEQGGNGSAGGEFFVQAEAAFQGANYRDALRLANHAAVESPQNMKAHELMSLSLFALGDYRGAATEAHAAIALGPITNWDSLYAYYNDPDAKRYTEQLRALEKNSRENPNSAEAHFLRAYHYLMIARNDAAKEQLADVVKLVPKDKMAAELLKKYGGEASASPPVPPPPSANPPGKAGAGGTDS